MTESWRIGYNHDMYHLDLQMFKEVRRILALLDLRHEEKCRRRDLVLQMTGPLLWKVWGREIETLRNSVRTQVKNFVQLTETTYKKRRESPTS